MLKFAKIALVCAASSVENERIFSRMNQLKKLMPNLSPKEMYHRLLFSRSKEEGVSVDIMQAIKIFSEAKVRDKTFREAMNSLVEIENL